jgi:hypothetical protein
MFFTGKLFSPAATHGHLPSSLENHQKQPYEQETEKIG